MAQNFQGRTYAITGGASGIGLAITKALASQGATVYIADIAKNPPQEVTDAQNIYFIGEVDVRSREACKKFIAAIPGRLDGLVNSAGVCFAEGKLAPDDMFERIMSINVNGSWYMGSEAMLRMESQETKVVPGLLPESERTLPAGSIVNLASGAGFRGISGLAAYCTSKHAVVGMTRSWAKDFRTIRVNAVAPGVTDTPLARGMSGNSSDDFDKMRETLVSRIPLGRMAYATDIADAVLFLLSDAASFITGQTIPVNGGSD